MKHAWKATAAPYKLYFKDLRDKIDESARRIDNIVNTLEQEKIKEFRDIIVRLEKSMSSE